MTKLTRRRMLRHAGLAGMAVWTANAAGARGNGRSPNEKLNIAVVGIGGRGAVNLDAVAGENIVALCDVDERRAGDGFGKFSRARKYHDFRKMFTEMDKQIDAVVVSTPDHTHAVAAAMAIRMGKHCYCEKPLTHSVHESRLLTELAARNKLATQLGTQRHAFDNFGRAVGVIRSGTIGEVRECHVWIGGNRGGGERPADKPPVPAHLEWDLWLGPAPYRPYHSDYAPYRWRFWWDFGTGETGNMGCHLLDQPFTALALRYPTTVTADGPPVHPETTPRSMRVRYEFPARGKLPPLVLHWCHGTAPSLLQRYEGASSWQGNGILFVGKEGALLANTHTWKLLPESKFADLQPTEPPTPEHTPSQHYQEWIMACKTGSRTSCSFDYAGPLTETVLLGNVAYRVGKAFRWDAENLTAIDCPEADKYIHPEYRKGWTL